jgi:hypothetical protein
LMLSVQTCIESEMRRIDAQSYSASL